MKLLVDVGNSRLKWAFSTSDGLSAPGEAALQSLSGSLPAPLLESGLVPDEIRMANVAGGVIGVGIAAQLAHRFGRQPVMAASPGFGAGVTNGYRQPRQLGIDRWLAICAAYSRYRSAVWVVDAGTATTVDHVTKDGHHRGGLILPGIELMESVLFQRTGDLARLAGAEPASGKPDVRGPVVPVELGRDTAAAIRMGALQATSAVIVRCLSANDGEEGSDPDAARLVVTGGLGRRLLANLGWPPGSGRAGPARTRAMEFRPALVLEGLALDPPCYMAAEPGAA